MILNRLKDDCFLEQHPLVLKLYWPDPGQCLRGGLASAFDLMSAEDLCSDSEFQLFPDGTGFVRQSGAIWVRLRFYPNTSCSEPLISNCQRTTNILCTKGGNGNASLG